ncbi:hypothetical protein [Collimonas humicola]|uniref:hypothetical protein n=1 Tax=Collimonas humicola TaxID=2825886 RepID=UPI001B8D4DBC|nr:hypothetical protein [Collimonas humicola]
MLFIRIDQIEVFDISRTKYGTEISLHVDGATIRSIWASKSAKPSSGIKTVGAFKNENKESLVAWIDPASGSLIYVGDSIEKFISFAIVPFFVLSYALAFRVGWLISERSFVIAISIFVIFLSIMCLRIVRRSKLIDQKLRTALANLE